jgi:hypothetical protein
MGRKRPPRVIAASRDFHRLSTAAVSSAPFGFPNLHSPTMATDLHTRPKSCQGVLKGKEESS